MAPARVTVYKATPDQVRLILVDPKRLELNLYENIPHLIAPVVTDPKIASNVLRNATREMENRLKLLAQRGVRNIAAAVPLDAIFLGKLLAGRDLAEAHRGLAITAVLDWAIRRSRRVLVPPSPAGRITARRNW